MTRAQIPQLFMFLMALLVIGATLFIGVKMFGWLSATACEASDVAFAKDLNALLDENGVFGSRNTVSISNTCDAIEICFVDQRFVNTLVPATDDAHKVLNAKISSGLKSTVYILTEDDALERSDDVRVTLQEPGSSAVPANPLCIPAIGGKFTFTIDGYGRTVKIS